MNEREVNYRFYTPTLNSSEGKTFKQLLEAISKIDMKLREIPVEGGLMKLEDFHVEKNGMVAGSLTHGKFDDIPGQGKAGEHSKDLNIDDDAMVMYMTVFAYCPHKNVLVFQSNKYGISIGRFTSYLMQTGHIKTPLHMDATLSKDAWERFKKMKTISCFNVEAELAPKPARASSGNESFDTLTEMVDKFGGLKIKMQISVGNKTSHSLTTEEVMADAEAIVNQIDGNDAIINDIYIKGKYLRGKTDKVDLKEDFIHHKGIVTYQGRRIDFKNLYLSVMDAYARKAQLL